MDHNLSIFTLISEASLLVQLVMLLLLVLSILSWAIVFQKLKLLKAVTKSTNRFENQFWSGGDVSALYKSLQSKAQENTGIESIFVEGYSEYARLNKHNSDHGVSIAGTQRAMRVALARELDRLDAHNDFLATVGSVSPYIGLFGTVWGIMNAFRGLASTENATLAMVAPGISEALIATAMGLFAAIPSVVAYNRFSHDVDKIMTRLENFADEFINILQRQS